MSSIFEERERGYEAKWAHDEEKHFAILAERNRRLAAWAAEKMNLPATERDHYVQAVLTAWLDGHGPDPVFEKISQDFQAGHVVCSQSELRARMKTLFELSEKDVASSP